MDGRIPSTVKLPFGYVVQIKQVPPKDSHLHSPDFPDDDLDGCWVEEEKTIYLNKALSPTRRRYIFVHEYQHVVLDWCHEMLLKRTAKSTG